MAIEDTHVEADKLIANYYRSQVQNSSRRSVHEAGMMPTAGHNRPEGEGIEVVFQGDGEGSVGERAAVPTAGHTRPGGEGIEVVIQGDGEGSVDERAAVPTAGHTRPGGGGNREQRYRRTFVSSLEDVAEVVKVSADVNVAQLVGTQSGQPIVPVYDWVNFFAGRFRSIPQLKSFQHFIFSSAHPGIVVLKAYGDSSETRFTMLNDATWSPSTSMLPQTIRPSGLPLARQWYLYRQIRDYCRDGTEDLTCPKPSDPLDTTSQGSDRQQELSEEESGSTAHPPPAKKLRRCGKCGETGHTRRSCKHH